MDRVTVYRFTIDDANPETDGLAPRAATENAIRRILGATPVVESAQVVDTHCLDSQGFLIDGCS